VEHLVQTHAHIDHVLGLKATKEHYPTAPIYMHKLDIPTYDLVPHSAKKYNIPIGLPLPPVDIFLSPSTSLVIGQLQFDVLFTPGHAPGHCVFYHRNQNKGGVSFAFVGDLIFQNSVGRTDLPGSCSTEMKKSIQRIVKLLPADCLLLPGHGNMTSMAEEIAHNPFVRDWVS
jgi:hydroxyacylglutathione hydrolase